MDKDIINRELKGCECLIFQSSLHIFLDNTHFRYVLTTHRANDRIFTND